MKEDENDSSTGVGMILRPAPHINFHYVLGVRGRIVDKHYVKQWRAFMFRVKTDKEFNTDDDEVVAVETVYQFVVFKPLYRKYRKFIYNNNYVEVVGILRQHDIFVEYSGETARYIIEMQAISQCKESASGIPKLSEIPEMPEMPMQEALLQLPELTRR
jgi:hypothetical protein